VAVLERHGHAVQRPQGIAARHGRVGGLRGPARSRGVQRHHRAQRRIVRVDAVEVRLQDFSRAQLAALDRRRDRARGQGAGIEGCGHRAVLHQPGGLRD
jgi:hypothetical protein